MVVGLIASGLAVGWFGAMLTTRASKVFRVAGDRFTNFMLILWRKHSATGRLTANADNLMAIAGQGLSQSTAWEVDVPLPIKVSRLFDSCTLLARMCETLAMVSPFSKEVDAAVKDLLKSYKEAPPALSKFSAVYRYAGAHLLLDQDLLRCFSKAAPHDRLLVAGSSGLMFVTVGSVDNSVDYAWIAWMLEHLATRTDPEDLPLMAAEDPGDYGPDRARAALALYLLQGGGSFCEACGLKRKSAHQG